MHLVCTRVVSVWYVYEVLLAFVFINEYIIYCV